MTDLKIHPVGCRDFPLLWSFSSRGSLRAACFALLRCEVDSVLKQYLAVSQMRGSWALADLLMCGQQVVDFIHLNISMQVPSLLGWLSGSGAPT
jgi:hypothetical protein